MNTREKFEQWWVRLALGRNTPDWYSHEGKAAAMAAWQARPEFTALCHSKTRQIGKPGGYLVENEAGGLAVVHNLGRVTWLDDCVAGPVEKVASAQDGETTPEGEAEAERAFRSVQDAGVCMCGEEMHNHSKTANHTPVEDIGGLDPVNEDQQQPAQDGGEPVAYPNCDTCGGSMDYMPWHYSTEFERHKHACDKCWPEVNPANPPSAVVPDERGTNEYGLDVGYFRKLFNRELSSLRSFRPDELARVLARAARTADASVLQEGEFQPSAVVPEWFNPHSTPPAHYQPVVGHHPEWIDSSNHAGVRECFTTGYGDVWLNSAWLEGADSYQTGKMVPLLWTHMPTPSKQEVIGDE